MDHQSIYFKLLLEKFKDLVEIGILTNDIYNESQNNFTISNSKADAI